MFEELCRKTGTIRLPVGEYFDGQAEYENYPVLFFEKSASFRDPQTGAVQLDQIFMCKPADGVSFPAPLPGDIKFVDATGQDYDIDLAQILYNHFDDVLEFIKLVVAK